MPVVIICKTCNEPFPVIPARADKAKYCSRECTNRAKTLVTGPDHKLFRRVLMKCEQCGKEKWVQRAKVDEFRFCSRRCQGSFTSKLLAEKHGPTDIEQLLIDEMTRRGIEFRWQHPIAHW